MSCSLFDTNLVPIPRIITTYLNILQVKKKPLRAIVENSYSENFTK